MTDQRRSMLRARLLAFAILIATFVAGALTGVAYERTLAADEPAPRMPRRGGPHGPPPSIFAAGGPLAERLDLTPEQTRRIEAILAEDRAKARAAFDEIEPRLRARFDSTRAAVSAVLTPEQRAEFEQLQRERRQRLRERFGDAPREGGRLRRGPLGPPGGHPR